MRFEFLRRYCLQYAEPLAQVFFNEIANVLTRQYQFVLCIPVFDEPEDFIAQVLQFISENILVILIFNAPDQGFSHRAILQTECSYRSVTQTKKQLSLVTWSSNIDLLTVDCCTEGRRLSRREGVGLARKIAGDLAVAAIAHEYVISPWIFCSDGDVKLPAQYFDISLKQDDKCAALLYPFIHTPLHENILQYEISLRYYIVQLAQQGSPYAFQTVGSSMAAHSQSYAAVRGFPKRNAAEDFYILNKLAKTGEMIRLNTPPLVLSSRQSDRVPFGTGAAMNRLAENPIQRLYHPKIFRCMGQWFAQMDKLWASRDRVQSLGLEAWWAANPIENDQVLPVLMEQGLPKVLKQAFRQCRDRPHFLYYLHVWFDAFRTLRFIHLMRDRGYPSIQIAELAEFIPEFAGGEPSLENVNNSLKAQEQALAPRIGPTQLLSSPLK